MDIRTICVHGCDKRYDNTGAVAVPIFASATFAHPGVGKSTGFDYSRTLNPTREHLEYTMAALEGGVYSIAFSSGMAAVMALMELFLPGDHVVAPDDLYGGTYRLFEHISKKNGINFTYINTLEGIEKAIRPETKAIFIETPTNPMMHVIDIAAVSRIARGRKLTLVVDNTFLTPYCQRPLKLGADIVLHSGTKYLGGHNDTLAGILVTSNPGLYERLIFIAKTVGACLSPFDSFLIVRGIKTLAVRMDRMQESAMVIAKWLTDHSAVDRVYYTGLPDHPGYEISRRQASGFGGMISFSLKNPETAARTLERVKIIKYAESLGGTESLITYPMLQTHADMPEEERNARGINAGLLRLSVGVEAVEDLIADLKQAIGETK
ncbi:MAG: PLP-dependent aspartate aminotransferase family protein [Chitinispirillales bacterium]|jgi:cystathionine beta-lyase/cystathionine gamma-synthase|nr:PLP-dependent aspartate aminotransferase family protein [Chitinispirillales bacterium]